MQILYTPLSKIVLPLIIIIIITIIIIIIIINTLFILQKNRPTEYEKTAGINLSAVIKYFNIKKKKKTIVHSKKAERLIFTIKKVLKN